ncbi:MFS-type transporter SLC18B1-like [Haliotis rubra]|uniref:MFS-type transporter SLC18B1-like n=1 Tax=Haliotis rubra TaxID=36100 RepID=UPI001EE52ADA|nr:MFS-type transporter SLC18B1-like [Haliotis rubra]
MSVFQFNISQSVIGVIYATCPGAYSVSCMVSASILERNVPAVPVLVTGICCLAIDFLFIGPAPILSFVESTLWLSILSMGLVGIFTAAVVTSAVKYIFKQARNLGYDNSNSTFGLLSGLIQSPTYFGSFIGPLLGGALTEHFGFAWAMTWSILVIMLPLLLCCTLICFRSWHVWQPSILKQDNYVTLEGN